MTFETTAKGNLWTHSPRYKDGKLVQGAKGGRRDKVAKGVYVIDHRPTGRFIIGSSSDVSKEVDRHIAQLTNGKHPNKLLQTMYQIPGDKHGNPPAIVVTEYPLNDDRAIKRTLKEIRETNTTDYCLLN